MAKVLVSESNLQNIANAIRDKNSSSDTYTPSEMAQAIEDIPSGGGETPEASLKDVNFYDYDGKRVYSYTKNEFLQLTAFPENPTHTGLISQGWNWDFANAVSYVTKYGKCDIGQMYVTDDNATRYYITVLPEHLQIYQGFQFKYLDDNKNVTIDWGDGTVEEYTNVAGFTHTYSAPGNYVVSFYSEGKTALYGTSSGNYSSIFANLDVNENTYLRYNSIYKIELGGNMSFYDSAQSQGKNAFGYIHGLKYITMHKDIEAMHRFLFDYCYSLECVILPKKIKKIYNSNFANARYGLKRIILNDEVEAIETQAFMYNDNLVSIILPESITTISNYAISYCSSLSKIIIPKGLTNIPASLFYNGFSLKAILFTQHEVVPTLANKNAFTNVNSACKIVVPDALYDDWIVATNWSDSSVVNKIIKASEYEE